MLAVNLRCSLLTLLCFGMASCLRIQREKPEVKQRIAPMEWLQGEVDANFPSMPQNPSFFNTSPSLVPDPCSADILLQFNPAGFGSKVTNMMGGLAMAAYGNYSFAVYGNSKGFYKTFDFFFQNSIPVCNKNMKDRHSPVQTLAMIFWGKLNAKDPEYATNALRSTYARNLVYSDKVARHIEQALEENGLDKAAKFLGVHIRHGDKKKETPSIPTETYGHGIAEAGFEHIQAQAYSHYAEEIQKLGTKTVWLATDDRQALDVLNKTLGAEYEIKSLNAKAVKWRGSKHASDFYYPDSQSVYDLLVDVEALRRAENFIGTGSSNIGRLVYYLRPAGSKATSLDSKFR